MTKNSKIKKSLIAEVKKAQEEVGDLQGTLEAGKLDRIKLESGIKEMKKHLEVMMIHTHKIDPGTG